MVEYEKIEGSGIEPMGICDTMANNYKKELINLFTHSLVRYNMDLNEDMPEIVKRSIEQRTFTPSKREAYFTDEGKWKFTKILSIDNWGDVGDRIGIRERYTDSISFFVAKQRNVITVPLLNYMFRERERIGIVGQHRNSLSLTIYSPTYRLKDSPKDKRMNWLETIREENRREVNKNELRGLPMANSLVDSLIDKCRTKILDNQFDPMLALFYMDPETDMHSFLPEEMGDNIPDDK